MTEEVLLGTAFVTDRGDWTAGTAYEENDIVHTSSGVYMSLADDNTAEVTDTDKWRTWVDLVDVTAASAASKEMQTAEASRVSAETARASAEEARQTAEEKRQTDTAAAIAAAKVSISYDPDSGSIVLVTGEGD